MIKASITVLRGSKSVAEEWGEFEFLSLPSSADRIMVKRDGTENYATVISVHHYPCPVGGADEPTADVLAKWTGSGAKLR